LIQATASGRVKNGTIGQYSIHSTRSRNYVTRCHMRKHFHLTLVTLLLFLLWPKAGIKEPNTSHSS
jgi:hypothetical protein